MDGAAENDGPVGNSSVLGSKSAGDIATADVHPNVRLPASPFASYHESTEPTQVFLCSDGENQAFTGAAGLDELRHGDGMRPEPAGRQLMLERRALRRQHDVAADHDGVRREAQRVFGIDDDLIARKHL